LLAAPAVPAATVDYQPTLTPRDAKQLQEIMSRAISNPDDTIAVFEARDLSNDSAAYDFALGNLYYQADRLPEAVQAYSNAVGKLPHFRAALNNMGRVYLLQERPELAIGAFHALLSSGQADAEMLLLLGHALLMQQQSVSAEGAYRQALLFRPNDAEAMRGLIKCLLDQSRYAEAVVLIRERLAMSPGDGELWSLRAAAFLALDRQDDAVLAIESARRLGCASSELIATLGDLYLNRQQMDDAVNAYRLAFSDGASAGRLLRAARGLLLTGQLEEAERWLKRIQDASPAEARTQRHLTGELALARGQDARAQAIYQQLIQEDPLNGEAILSLAGCLTGSGTVEEASMLYERAARLSGYEAQAMIRHAQLEVGRDRFDRAVELLEAAQAIEPQPHVARYLEQVRRLAQRRHRH
ncbi:MAG: tetratricopeptide repeat protein, partial [Verrucomicrobia bacterium]|nr:tetratricopeptide repeat protein [Verrucomicrobiota bacterium]